MNPTIAGVVLTLNEEANLSRALSSLDWCDEVVVLDSGSTDRTHQIAQQYGARFYVHIQASPFTITDQRNWALTNCHITSQWVLFIDADEEVTDDLRSSLLKKISTCGVFNSYELTPRYLFFGKWLRLTQGYPNWHPRLLRRGEVSFDGGVWETFSPGSKTDRIASPYEHHAFSKGLNDWLDRHKRYSDWDSECIYQYLLTRDKRSFKTRRLLKARRIASILWPLRPLFRFLQKYVLQLGFLEGWQGLLFCLLMSFYELMVIIKVIEKFQASAQL